MVLVIFSIIVIGINTIYCFYKTFKEKDMGWLFLGLLCAFTLALIITNKILLGV